MNAVPLIDLHTHSLISDGTDTPFELCAAAATAGLSVIALTDHDTNSGWQEARQAARQYGLGFMPGIEVSAKHRGISTHLLAFGVDPSPKTVLSRTLASIRDSRLNRARVMTERLAADFPITWDMVTELASAGLPALTSVGRPHLADALVSVGAASDRSEAFEKILHPQSPYYVPYASFEAADAIEAIHVAGGVVVGAHLLSAKRGKPRDADAILELIDQGLDGVEVDHREHSDDQRAWLRSMAHKKGLIVTGGSDYHGTGKPNRLGEHTTNSENLDRIVEATGVEL